MRCERRDGSFYGTAGRCIKGVEVGPKEKEWVEKQAREWPMLQAKLQSLAESVAGLPDDEREIFNKQISTHLNANNLLHHWKNLKGERLQRGEQRLPYSPEKKLASMESQIKGWKEMIAFGYPKQLQFRDGTLEEAPKGMIPIVMQASGQKKWVRDGDNRVFNIKSGGIATQNRAGKEDTNRYVPAAAKFQAEQKKKGEEWPTQKVSPRTDIELDPDKIMAKLSNANKRTIALNGLAVEGNANMPGAILYAFYKKPENKALLEQRVREVVERYVAQGGRSGVTGLPIALPGIKPDPTKGEGKSTVDHFNPISGARGLSEKEVIAKFDNRKNFLLAEEGPNSNRGSKPWEDWLVREQGKAPKNSGTDTAVQPKIVKTPSQAPKPTQYTLSNPEKQTVQQKIDDLLNEIKQSSKPTEAAKDTGMTTWSVTRLQKAWQRAHDREDEKLMAQIQAVLNSR